MIFRRLCLIICSTGSGCAKSAEQLGLLADWLDTDPEVPNERWFKRFPEMIFCGEGELVKTFLTANQMPTGTEVH